MLNHLKPDVIRIFKCFQKFDFKIPLWIINFHEPKCSTNIVDIFKIQEGIDSIIDKQNFALLLYRHVSLLLFSFSAWTRYMPGVSIPSITESQLWPICVHTQAQIDMLCTLRRVADDWCGQGCHGHWVIKRVGCIRISLKFVQSLVFGWSAPVKIFRIFHAFVLFWHAHRLIGNI